MSLYAFSDSRPSAAVHNSATAEVKKQRTSDHGLANIPVVGWCGTFGQSLLLFLRHRAKKWRRRYGTRDRGGLLWLLVVGEKAHGSDAYRQGG